MSYLHVINLVIIFYYRKLLHQPQKLLHRGLYWISELKRRLMTICGVAWSSDALLCIFQLQKLAGLDFGVLSDRNLVILGLESDMPPETKPWWNSNQTVEPDLKSMLWSHSVNCGCKIMFSDHFWVYRAQNPM